MKKGFYYVLQVACVLSLTNCASILNPKMQKVVINTNNPNTKVYVNDKLEGEGTAVLTRMERDQKVKQIRTETEGFKPEYRVHVQTKKSPYYILSWIPFGVLLYPPFNDKFPRSFDYDKIKIVKNELPVSKRQESEKFIYLRKTAMNVKKEDMVVESYGINQYNKNKKPYRSETGKKDIELNNTIFTDAINEVLTKNGYVDTTKTIFKDKTNTLYINADVKSMTFKDVTSFRGYETMNFSVAEATIDWEVLDFYGQTKLKKTVKCSSGEFSPDFIEDSDDYLSALMEDAVATSFFTLLQMKDVKELVQKDKVQENKFDLITIEAPTTPINQLNIAQNATVTIISKDGHGSGCVISKDGYIVTNYHVIAGSSKLEAVLNDGRKVNCEVVRFNEVSDLALLKLDEKFKHFYTLPTISKYSVGEDIFAIGTPNSVELGQTLSKGIISGIRKKDNLEWIQTDVSVNPGNSGGALVNKNGELVGIVNSKLIGFGVEGIAFCIPAQKLFEDLKITYKVTQQEEQNPTQN